MKLTNASTYALRALGSLARHKNGAPTPSHETAREEGIPERFLLKIFKPLVAARILRSVKGPNGGYSLARPAKDITLLEVVEAVDGPVRGYAPLVDDAKADRLDRKLQDICEEAATSLRARLGKVSVADLAGRGK
jgi:Rrf2 family protein